MSTIAAGTTSTTALVSTADTTGNLVLQTNGTTTALTINTAQAVGVGTSPSYGTSGQVLTSSGSAAAPTWVTPAYTSFSSAMTQLTSKLVNLGVTSASFKGSVQLSSTTQMLFWSAGGFWYAAVYDSSSDTMGSPTNVGSDPFIPYVISSTSVLCAYITATTTINVAVASVSGTTISVGTAATAASFGTLVDLVKIGSTYVLAGYNSGTTVNNVIGATVSGSTVTLGSVTAATAAGVSTFNGYLWSYSATSGVLVCSISSVGNAVGFTVSGTTITVGSAATFGTTVTTFVAFHGLSSGRVIALTGTSTSTCQAALISLSGSTATVSTAATTKTYLTYANFYYSLSTGNNVLLAGLVSGGSGFYSVVFTDTSGTISTSTETAVYSGALGTSGANFCIYPASSSSIGFVGTLATGSSAVNNSSVSVSSNAPLVSNFLASVASVGGVVTTVTTYTENVAPKLKVFYNNAYYKLPVAGVGGNYYPITNGSGGLVYAPKSTGMSWAILQPFASGANPDPTDSTSVWCMTVDTNIGGSTSKYWMVRMRLA